MRALVALLLLTTALAVATPEAAACHPIQPAQIGPVWTYVDPHGCGPKPDPVACAGYDEHDVCLV